MIKFKFFIACLALLPLSVSGEDISFTKHITYTGKVDANKRPSGKGKLEVIYNQQKDLRKDVIEGVFNNGVVTDAKLAFDKHNGPLWINSCTFKGTVEYIISEDGSSITFKMTEGKFKDGNMRTISVTQIPFEIKRTPFDDKCELSAEPFVSNYSSPAYHPSITDMIGMFDTSILGTEGSYSQAETFILGGDWKLTSVGIMDVFSYPNGMKFMRIGTRTGCDYPNGDTYTYDVKQKKVVSFRKSFTDAVVVFNSETNNAEVKYSDNGIYKGTIDLGSTGATSADFFQHVMQAQVFANSGLSLQDGVLERNGQTVQYYNGRTKEEIEIEKKEEQAIKAQAAKAEAEKREKNRQEIVTKYGVLDNEDGNRFSNYVNQAENGYDEAWAAVGHCLRYGIGVKTNIKLATDCISKARNSKDKRAQVFGTMFMADMLWTGATGLVKDQKKAIQYYGEVVGYNGWWASPYQSYYSPYLSRLYYRFATLFETGQLGIQKDIDKAIECYKECIQNNPSDEIFASAKYKLGYYIEKGRYRAIRNRYGTIVPNTAKAREYYQDAVKYGDAKTKSLAKQGLQRIGY